ncbi:MAG: sigma 54-interacting transcriptional regulator [Desulfomicrobium escambiense]|nr:sigma 54-interacting transcriptional regulator [Desulfomicrobium escambiense]
MLDALFAEEALYFVALLDGDGRVLAWNSRFEGYLPLSLREAGAAGRDHRLAGGQDLQRPVRVRDRGRPPLPPLPRLRPDRHGRTCWPCRAATSFLLSALILLAGALFFRGLYALQSRYVAKAREAEAERQEKERFREISAFTSGVAHEIKNPLNSLSLLFELLDRRASSDMKGISTSARPRCGRSPASSTASRTWSRPSGRTVEDVVLDSRPGRGRRQPGRGSAPGGLARPRSKPAPGVRLAGDRDLLAQALLNLLKNAVEASPDGPGHGVRAAGPAAGSRSWSATTGPGLPPEAAERLFEPFYTTKEKGMGIGLYLTEEDHRGPRRDDRRPQPARRRDDIPDRAAGSVTWTEPLILVVEDDPVQRRLIRENLESRGYAGDRGRRPARRPWRRSSASPSTWPSSTTSSATRPARHVIRRHPRGRSARDAGHGHGLRQHRAGRRGHPRRGLRLHRQARRSREVPPRPRAGGGAPEAAPARSPSSGSGWRRSSAPGTSSSPPRPWRRSPASSPRPRGARPRSSSRARRERARTSWPGPSTRPRPARTAPTSPSTSPLCRRRSSRPSSSAPRRAPSPGPTSARSASSRPPRAARSSSTRSATWRPEAQVKLLRFLQDREFYRLGSNQPLRADVRVIAATNRDLDALRAQGRFRDDLFYRLNVIPIAVPPLRDRKEDIPLLVDLFIKKYAAREGKTITGHHPGGPGRASSATPSRATSASSRTSSSGPWSSPNGTSVGVADLPVVFAEAAGAGPGRRRDRADRQGPPARGPGDPPGPAGIGRDQEPGRPGPRHHRADAGLQDEGLRPRPRSRPQARSRASLADLHRRPGRRRRASTRSRPRPRRPSPA